MDIQTAEDRLELPFPRKHCCFGSRIILADNVYVEIWRAYAAVIPIRRRMKALTGDFVYTYQAATMALFFVPRSYGGGPTCKMTTKSASWVALAEP